MVTMVKEFRENSVKWRTLQRTIGAGTRRENEEMTATAKCHVELAGKLEK